MAGFNSFQIKRKNFMHNRRQMKWREIAPTYLLLLPGLLYLLFNNYMPMFGIVMAFKKINFGLGIFKSPWTGFDNFRFLFASGDAWSITRNTIFYNIVFILLNNFIGMMMAVFLYEVRKKRITSLYQSIILLPYLMSWVVVSYLVYAFLGTNTGLINNSLLSGRELISFYQEPRFWPFILVFVNQWKGIGVSMIIYFSYLSSINTEVFEAATVDGATKLQQLKYIIVPLLKPIAVTLILLAISKMFYSDFGLFYQIPKNSGMLYSVTQTIDTYVYRTLMRESNFGMAAAAGLYQSFVGLVLVITANFVIKKISPDDSLF